MGLKQIWQRIKRFFTGFVSQFEHSQLETAIYEFMDFVGLGPLKSSSPIEKRDWFQKAEILAVRIKNMLNEGIFRIAIYNLEEKHIDFTQQDFLYETILIEDKGDGVFYETLCNKIKAKFPQITEEEIQAHFKRLIDQTAIGAWYRAL